VLNGVKDAFTAFFGCTINPCLNTHIEAQYEDDLSNDTRN